MLQIIAHEDGPFVLKGRARYEAADQTIQESPGDAVALCRCGQTASAPFCDGKHREVGFHAAGCELTVEVPVASDPAVGGDGGGKAR